MSFVVRALLIGLLVLAVPLQGFAAATMAFCSPDHHGRGAAVTLHASVPADHAHHGAAATDHGHPQAGFVADEDTASPAEPSGAKKHNCSACASCCSVGAILNSVVALPVPTFTPTGFSTLEPSVDAFAAGGPDRPPRFVLA